MPTAPSGPAEVRRRVGYGRAVQVVIGRSRVKAVLAVLGCVLFVIASLAILTVGSALSFVIGVLGLITFGCFGLAWVVLGLRRGPGLIIDDEGFDDASSATAVGRVPWSDVAFVGEWSTFSSRVVVVEVRHPETYLSRVSWFGRLAARLNVRLVGSPVTLSSVSLRTSHDALLELLRTAHARFTMSC
jgi:hypothetical protein